MMEINRDISSSSNFAQSGKVQELRSRSKLSPRYLLIDFGISRRYQAEDRPPSEGIIRGADKTPPEHQGDVDACDPFPTDIYYLGNMVREEFTQVRLCTAPSK
jgi:hypothetical protein